MASILRSGKFVRYFAGFARNFVFNTPREVEGNFPQVNASLCSGYSSGFATVSIPKNDQNLDKSIKRLDQDVRRSGRISRRDIEEVLEEIRHKRSATSSQSLLVIRCCGNLVPEELPEIRTTLVQEIWKTLNNLNVPMDISHYNALLRVYLENEHLFSPTDFLADLEAKGVEPNRVTYQRLISRYCQQGDIEGATKILEFMREKQLPINEHVFNALITGHSEAGDMESSIGILGVMKQAGLEPSADTYTTLLCSYAKVGDIAAILKTLEQCEQSEIYLMDKDILDVIYALATNGHADKIDQLLPQLRKSSGFNQDAVNIILRLTNCGQEDVAFKILKVMPRSSRADGDLTDTGNFFIKQLIKAKRPVEKILQICRELQADGLNGRAMLIAVESSLTSGFVEVVLPFLKELKATQTDLRQHYFWPLICREAKKGTNEVLDIVQKMQNEFGLLPNGETIREYVVPNLRERNHEKVISLLRSAGVSTSTAATSVAHNLLVNDRLKEAATIAKAYNVYYQPGLFRRPLVFALVKTNDFESYISFVRSLYDGLQRFEQLKHQRTNQPEEDIVDAEFNSENNQNSEVLGQIVFDALVNLRTNRPESITKILNGLVEQGLTISNGQAERIQERLGSELTDEISMLLSKLTAGDLEPVHIERSQSNQSNRGFQQMESAQLERMIAQLTSKGEQTNGIKRILLSAYYKEKELEKFETLVSKLETEDFTLTSGIYVQLLDLYSNANLVDKATDIYQKIKLKEPDFVMDDTKIIRLVAAFVASGRIEEATKYLSENKKAEVTTDERAFNYTSTCWRILNSLAEAGKAEDLQKIFDSLVENNFIVPNNVLLGPLVKIHIVNGDNTRAVETFEQICNKYNCTPWKNDLACKLIQAEDATNLQRLTDLSTNIHGEVNSLYDLVFSFVECGRIRQARKILETPGLRSRPQRINFACERYLQEGKVESLEGLIEATRDLNHIDRADIFYNLLLSYCKNDQPEKALGLWTKMQEEDIAPTEIFLIKLGTFLKSKDLEVPFKIPEKLRVAQQSAPEQQFQTKIGNVARAVVDQTVSKQSPTMANFKKALRSGDVDAIQAAKSKLLDSDTINLTDQSVFIETLINADRLNEATKLVLELCEQKLHPIPRIFRYYLNKIAIAGELETLQRIEPTLSEGIKKMVSFDNRLCTAYLAAGKVEQLLTHFEQTIDGAKTEAEIAEAATKFPRGGAIGILEKHPELTDRFERLAEKYAAHKIVSPMNLLWMHFFLTDSNETKRNQIYEKYLADTPRLMFQRIVTVARETNDLVMAQRLIDQLKVAKVSEGAVGVAYSCVLDIHAANGNFGQGLEAINEAIKDVCLENINRTALLRIKEGLQKSGKTFPHKIPDKLVRDENSGTGGKKESSSSSSSSSSSDDEPSTPPKKE